MSRQVRLLAVGIELLILAFQIVELILKRVVDLLNVFQGLLLELFDDLAVELLNQAIFEGNLLVVELHRGAQLILHLEQLAGYLFFLLEEGVFLLRELMQSLSLVVDLSEGKGYFFSEFFVDSVLFEHLFVAFDLIFQSLELALHVDGIVDDGLVLGLGVIDWLSIFGLFAKLLEFVVFMLESLEEIFDVLFELLVFLVEFIRPKFEFLITEVEEVELL